MTHLGPNKLLEWADEAEINRFSTSCALLIHFLSLIII